MGEGVSRAFDMFGAAGMAAAMGGLDLAKSRTMFTPTGTKAGKFRSNWKQKQIAFKKKVKARRMKAKLAKKARRITRMRAK
jgi:hypothetical protein